MKTKKIPFNIEKAKNGAKIVTKNGNEVKIYDYDCGDKDYPIMGLIIVYKGFAQPIKWKKDGTAALSELDEPRENNDLFIEEEVEEEKETDYNPYKATVESIADMVEKYSELQTLEELKHFYNNVKVKCREAIEYDKKWCKKQEEQKPSDKVKTRRMTNQELSWWLHDHPEEHREMTYSNEDNYVSSDLSYLKSEANTQVYEKIVIRKNGGEWKEPLIEE